MFGGRIAFCETGPVYEKVTVCSSYSPRAIGETAIPVIAATTTTKSKGTEAEGVEPETWVSVRRAAPRQAPSSDVVEALVQVL